MDLFGEGLSGRAGQCPGGGAGGVVVEGERGGQVLGADLALAVGEGVEERESDGVRFGAGGDLPDDPAGLRFGELAVGVMPELAGVGVQADLARLFGRACGPGRAGGSRPVPCERVGVAAFGQQPLPAAGDEEDAIEVAVGELDAG